MSAKLKDAFSLARIWIEQLLTAIGIKREYAYSEE